MASPSSNSEQRSAVSVLHLGTVAIWAGMMLLLLASWISWNHPGQETKEMILRVSAAVVGLAGYFFAWRSIEKSELVVWYAAGSGLMLLAGIFSYLDRRPALTTGIALGLGLLLAGLAAYRGIKAFEFSKNREDVDRLSAGNRGFLKALLMLVGVAAFLFALWLAFEMGTRALAETLGLIFFALALIAPFFSGTDGDAPLLPSGHKAMGVSYLALSLVLGAIALFVGLKYRMDGLVPLVGLGLLAFTTILFAFLHFSNSDASQVRTMIPVEGTVIGIILIFTTVFHLARGQNSLVQGGLSSWRGDEAWKNWLAVYLLLLGLIIPLISLLAVRGGGAENPGIRKATLRYQGGFLFVFGSLLFLVLNFGVYALFPQTFSWTQSRGLYTISGATKRLLAGLKEPLHFYVLVGEQQPGYADLKTMFNNCQVETNLVHVHYFPSLYDNKDALQLYERFKKIPQNVEGVLVTYGPEGVDPNQPPRHAFVGLQEMLTQNQKEKTFSFKGEEAVMAEVKQLAYDNKKLAVYFTQGQGELDLADAKIGLRNSYVVPFNRVGAAEFFNKLAAEFQVKGLHFDLKPAKDASDKIVYLKDDKSGIIQEIPEDCDVLIVAGPSEPFSKAAMQQIERYLDRGGKMIASFDVVCDKDYRSLKKSGLESVLAKFGARVSDEFLLGLSPELIAFLSLEGMKSSFRQGKEETPINILRSARVVLPEATEKYQAETFLVVPQIPNRGQQVFPEDALSSLLNPKGHLELLFQRGELQKRYLKELSIGVVVSEKGSGNKDDPASAPKPRLVVLGDTEVMSNVIMTNRQIGKDAYNVFSSSINWLGGRKEFVGAPARDLSIYTLRPVTNVSGMLLQPLWVMALVIIGVGIGLWLVRRR